jgi:hypothetical protein
MVINGLSGALHCTRCRTAIGEYNQTFKRADTDATG